MARRPFRSCGGSCWASRPAVDSLEGYSVAETARALGVSENTIKTQLKKGLTRLRKELGDE